MNGMGLTIAVVYYVNSINVFYSSLLFHFLKSEMFKIYYRLIRSADTCYKCKRGMVSF